MLVKLLFVLVLLGLVVLAARLISKEAALENKVVAYQKRGPLLTPAERSFFGVLKQAVDERVLIFAKVRLADVITPAKTASASDRQKAFNKISAKHIDFLICRGNDLVPLLAIELNDRSHQTSRRKERDEFLANALKSAGLAYVFLPAKRSYSVAELQQMVFPHLSPPSEEHPGAPNTSSSARPKGTKAPNEK